MTDILCRWLNEELRLSCVIGTKTFASDFSNGYLIGEILHKYHLQKDLSVFINDDNSTSKVNNFSRLEPNLQSLGISFDGSTSQDLMQAKRGVARHLLYELYVTLEKKKKADSGRTITHMIPAAASARLRKKDQDIYCDMLHKGIRLSADTKQLYQISMEVQAAQQKQPLPERNVNMTTTVRVAKSRQKQREQQEQQQHEERQAQIVQNEIHQFEANARKLFNSAARDFFAEECYPWSEAPGEKEANSGQQFNSQYIQQIRQRLEAEAFTRKQREKRAAQFLVEQSKAHEAVQDMYYEQLLVKRLTRQTKEEERLVAQQLQIRAQKEVLLKNRLFQEQQRQKRREKDFQEALEKEAASARQERLNRADEIKREIDFCKILAAERKQIRYKKHFESCKEILGQIVDLATKAGDYRLLTGNLIPGKQMREWKELMVSGMPLYETINEDQEENHLDPVEVMKQDILNNHDHDE